MLRAIVVAAVLGNAGLAAAQSDPDPMSGMHLHGMHMAGPLGLTHARESSGTSWQPDATPVAGDHLMLGDWMVMAHYVVFGVFDQMYGPRGNSELFSANWGMVAVSHDLFGGQLTGRAMLSLEPATIRAGGYPLLLQVGEAYQGQPLHDVQHPHDLFMEVALTYKRELAYGIAAQIYAAPVGEPALGPTAFPHRESAAADPLAPITHHHLDSTHVSFGVVTAAIYTRTLKLESSVFNGHEPDEHRWNFDPIELNSFSARLQWAPCRGFVGQVSYGHLSSPEQLLPDVNQDRLTASGTVDHRMGDGNLAATLAYGFTKEGATGSSSLLAETNFDADGTNSVFGRFEWAQRTPEDLVLDSSFTGKPDVFEATLGYMYETGPIGEARAGVGIAGMLAFVPGELERAYGSTAEPGLMIFVRLRPANRL